jgi:hypothetical protein
VNSIVKKKKVVIYKRLILTAFCLGIIYFPGNGNCADKENIEEWYIVSRHGDYMPLKTIFMKHKELQDASTPQELVDKLKKNGDDVELVDLFANAKDKEKSNVLNVKIYALTSKSRELALIITNKNADEIEP